MNTTTTTTTANPRSSSSSPPMSFDTIIITDVLPDELLILIGQWVMAGLESGIEDYVRFKSTNKQLQRILSEPTVMTNMIHERMMVIMQMMIRKNNDQTMMIDDDDDDGTDDGTDDAAAAAAAAAETTTTMDIPTNITITTLQQLSLYEAVGYEFANGENRIGFGFASTLVDQEEGEESGIVGSRRRLEMIRSIRNVRRGDVRITIDAHCGTAAPIRGIAQRFSYVRGCVVREQLLAVSSSDVEYGEEAEPYMNDDDDDDDDDDIHVVEGQENMIVMNAWGRQVTSLLSTGATTNNHPFGEIARQGKGWVEIYIHLMGNNNNDDDDDDDVFTLPPRPNYYNGLIP